MGVITTRIEKRSLIIRRVRTVTTARMRRLLEAQTSSRGACNIDSPDCKEWNADVHPTDVQSDGGKEASG